MIKLSKGVSISNEEKFNNLYCLRNPFYFIRKFSNSHE